MLTPRSFKLLLRLWSPVFRTRAIRLWAGRWLCHAAAAADGGGGDGDDHDDADAALQTRANAAGALGNLVRNGPALVQVRFNLGY